MRNCEFSFVKFYLHLQNLFEKIKTEPLFAYAFYAHRHTRADMTCMQKHFYCRSLFLSEGWTKNLFLVSLIFGIPYLLYLSSLVSLIFDIAYLRYFLFSVSLISCAFHLRYPLSPVSLIFDFSCVQYFLSLVSFISCTFHLQDPLSLLFLIFDISYLRYLLSPVSLIFYIFYLWYLQNKAHKEKISEWNIN